MTLGVATPLGEEAIDRCFVWGLVCLESGEARVDRVGL